MALGVGLLAPPRLGFRDRGLRSSEPRAVAARGDPGSWRRSSRKFTAASCATGLGLSPKRQADEAGRCERQEGPLGAAVGSRGPKPETSPPHSIVSHPCFPSDS